VGDDPDTSLVISCFGPLDVRIHGRPLPRLRSRMGHKLVALLSLRAGREVSRFWLAGTLWPDATESQALVSLRSSLADLRRALGPKAPRALPPVASGNAAAGADGAERRQRNATKRGRD
jgi:DNA-binding SARP family transcriptional activator